MKYLTILLCFFVVGCPVYSEPVIIGGALRQDLNDCSKWYLINDSEHAPIGVNPELVAVADNNKIRFNYGYDYNQVVTLIVGADETLTSELGLTAGASVGLSFSDIKLHDKFGRVNPSDCINQPKGNLWFYGVMISVIP